MSSVISQNIDHETHRYSSDPSQVLLLANDCQVLPLLSSMSPPPQEEHVAGLWQWRASGLEVA